MSVIKINNILNHPILHKSKDLKVCTVRWSILLRKVKEHQLILHNIKILILIKLILILVRIRIKVDLINLQLILDRRSKFSKKLLKRSRNLRISEKNRKINRKIRKKIKKRIRNLTQQNLNIHPINNTQLRRKSRNNFKTLPMSKNKKDLAWLKSKRKLLETDFLTASRRLNY